MGMSEIHGKGRVWALLAVFLVAGVLGCALKEYRDRAFQSEAMANLGAIYSAQECFFNQNGRYGRTFEEIGWTPEGDNNYAYFLGESVLQSRVSGPYSLPEGVKSCVKEKAFLAVAVVNLDRDPQLDVWTMNENRERVNLISDVGWQ